MDEKSQSDTVWEQNQTSPGFEPSSDTDDCTDTDDELTPKRHRAFISQWMIPHPTPAIRVGPEYQAAVPPCRSNCVQTGT